MKISLTKFYLLFALTNVVDSNDTFKRQTKWPSVADNQLTTLQARSDIECALHLDSEDSGFAFNQPDHTCYLLHCVNPNVTDDSVDMSSLQVYLKEVDYTLARGKPASMSTVHASYNGAGKAVDGIYIPDAESPSLTHSAEHGDNNPWWRVDLEQIYCVWGVNILNRALQSAVWRNRNKDVEVTVARNETQLMYDTNLESRCNYFDGPLNQYYTLIACIQPMRGQFVQIQYRPSSDSVINLFEIEVFGV